MDEFSDDGFDDLNDTTLQELENNAIQLTQVQRHTQTQTQTQVVFNDNEDYGLEDDDLDDTVVVDEAARLPVRHSVERQAPDYSTTAQSTLTRDSRSLLSRGIQQPRWQQPASGPKPQTQYQSTRPSTSTSARNVPLHPSISQRMGPPPLPTSTRAPPTSSQYIRPPAAPASSLRSVNPQDRGAPQQQQQAGFVPPLSANVVEALQARVRALENDLNSARGEVSIVRSKYDKSVASHDAEVSRLKKQNAEAIAKQERLVETALHAEKAAATELQFTRQDLREELQRSKKQRTESAQSGTSTPRKNKANPRKNVADGFDDVEILPSPSKGLGGPKGRSKSTSMAPGERTPTRGKRKRPPVDSPVTALEVEDDVAMNDAAAGASPVQAEATGTILKPSALPYDLLRLVLDHGAIHGQPLTFDLLARYSYPSDPDQSFAGIIFQKIPSLGDPHDPMRLLIDFCDMIIDLWDQCLKEKYYEPIYDLVALITFILQLNTLSVAPFIASTLIPIAHTTIYLLAVPRFESQNGDLSTSPDETIQHLTLNIDTEGVLQLMYLTALGCADSYLLDPANPLSLGPDRDPPQRLFWKLMQIDFVLVMLSNKQPRDEFLGMLSLLCASCLPDSIGPITDDPARDPEFVAEALIERISKIMYQPMLWVTTTPPSPASALPFGHRACVIRLAALQALMAFAQSPMGVKQLALKETAIPRLVNVLCGAVDALYDMDVPMELFKIPSRAPAEKAAAAAVEQDKAPGEVDEMQIDPPDDDSNPGVDDSLSPTTELEPNPTPLLYTLISSTVRLLHTLVTDPATSAYTDMRAKLSTSHGASQKYLLTLSRLNFAEEDLVLEAGIDQGTCDRANDLLDMAITPDEAEGVRSVFGGWS
ncbi:unnamed protein product [Discula destructiva]